MPFSTILIKTKVGGDRVEDSLRIADELERHAKIHGFRVIRDINEVIYPENTVMIPIGGDGTVLVAAKEAIHLNLPIIGINIGNLGFLTDLPPTQTREATHQFFDSLKNGTNLKYDRRTLLTLNVAGEEIVAMNDIVVSDRLSDSIIEYELQVGESNAGKHKANSVIVSTPTGSTAYAMFAGGAIIEPDLDVIEIVPVAAMSMSARPMIVGGHNVITVKVTSRTGRSLSVKADGQETMVPIPEQLIGKTIDVVIRRLEKKINLLHSSSWNYFDVLSQKLHWNRK
jgi:NAD+ kinase